MLVEQCALMHMIFGNDQGVLLLEHVRYLEQIWYVYISALRGSNPWCGNMDDCGQEHRQLF